MHQLLKAIYAGNFTAVPAGPVLLCPYVLDSQDVPALALADFTSFSFTDGVATATNLGPEALPSAQYAFSGQDYDRLQTTTPSGESKWWSIAPDNGKIAFEGEIVAVSDDPGAFLLQVYTGSPLEDNFAIVSSQYNAAANSFVSSVGGTGPRLLLESGALYDHIVSVGDRLAVVIDTATGAADFLSEYGHENFGGVPLIDLSDGAGFGLATAIGPASTAASEMRAYTKASDMQLPMPAGTTDPCLNPISNVLTAYPLDASEAEIQSFGYTGKLDMSLSNQRGEYTIQPTLSSSEQHIAASAKYITNIDGIDLSTGGPYAFEWAINLPTFTHSSTPSGFLLYEQESLFSDPLQLANLPPILVEFRGADDGTATVGITFHEEGIGASGNILSFEPISTGEHVVGMWVDPVSGIVRVWIDGEEKTLTSSTIPAGWNGSNLFPVMAVAQTLQDPDVSVGLVISSRLITDPYWFITPFPPGSVDIAGKILQAPYSLSNDAGLASNYQEATINGSFFSYVTPATPPANNQIGLDVGFTDKIPMWSDIRVIEFEVTRFDFGNLTYTGILDPNFYPNAYSATAVGDNQWTFFGDDVSTSSSPVAGAGTAVVGIAVNGSTGAAEFFLNGVSVGTSATTLHTSPEVMFTLYWDGRGAAAGDTVEGYIRTKGSEYTYNYGPGINDFQGAPIPV